MEEHKHGGKERNSYNQNNSYMQLLSVQPFHSYCICTIFTYKLIEGVAPVHIDNKLLMM